MASISSFISSDFATCFLIGFEAGALVASSVFLIRAVVKLFIRIAFGK